MASKKAGLPIKKAEGPTKPVPVKIVHDETDNPTISTDRERKYKAEDALRDLERAEGHRKDKSLMRDVKSLAKEKMKVMNKLC